MLAITNTVQRNLEARPKPDLLSYLATIPADATLQDLYMTEGPASQRFRPYQFVLEREGVTHAEFAQLFGRGTVTQYLTSRGLLDECIAWLEARGWAGGSFYCRDTARPGRTFVQYLQHVRRKVGLGLGYWDDSPRFVGFDSWPALIRKSMITAVHPVEDRYLNVREMLHLMGKDLMQFC